MNKNHLDLEQKIGRRLMEIEHKFDSKIMYLNEQLAEIKMERAIQTRLSKSKEGDLSTLTSEFKVWDIDY
jgi:hypothetical protein